jgi:hypothetical protein
MSKVTLEEQREMGLLRETPGSFVPPAPVQQPQGPVVVRDAPQGIDALTKTPESHAVIMKTSYADRAEGFTKSTVALWRTVAMGTGGIVLSVWLLGPVSGAWGWKWGAFSVSMIAAITLASLFTWAWAWSKWQHVGPDAIASRTADARLRMAEDWFYAELNRMYPEDDK